MAVHLQYQMLILVQPKPASQYCAPRLVSVIWDRVEKD